MSEVEDEHKEALPAELQEDPAAQSPSPVDPAPLLPLRSAREALGLTVEEAATQLNLGVETIQALEAGDYARLPPPTFVRGYLRGYGRLLQLDVERLVRQYDASRPSEPEITRVSRVGAQPGSGHPAVRWATTLIVLALIGMAALWWYRENQQPASDRAPTSRGPVDPAPSAAPPAERPTVDTIRRPLVVRSGEEPEPASTDEPAGPAGVASSGQTRPTSSAEPRLGEPPPLPAPALAPAPSAGSTPPARSGPGAVEAPAPAAGTRDAAVLAGPETPAAETAAPSSAAAGERAASAPAGTDVLVVTTDGESWLEVNDADGRQLYFDLLRGGQPARLQGRAPFRVFLGNSPAVDLRLNGVAVDQTDFTRGNNTARFVVDEAGIRRR